MRALLRQLSYPLRGKISNKSQPLIFRKREEKKRRRNLRNLGRKFLLSGYSYCASLLRFSARSGDMQDPHLLPPSGTIIFLDNVQEPQLLRTSLSFSISCHQVHGCASSSNGNLVLLVSAMGLALPLDIFQQCENFIRMGTPTAEPICFSAMQESLCACVWLSPVHHM